MSILRDILRRKARSLLTISGIAIGVFALVVLGASAEKAALTVRECEEYYQDKVTIAEEKVANEVGYSNGNRPLPTGTLDEVVAIPGVLDVAPQVSIALEPASASFGMPPRMVGGYTGTAAYEEEWALDDGRMLSDSETHVAVVGSDLVEQLDAHVGEPAVIRGEDFEVVGILEPTLTPMDQSVMVPLGDARAVFIASLPDPMAESVNPNDIALQATAYAAPGVDADELADRIEREVDGVNAIGPTELREGLSQTVRIYDTILGGVGVLALVIGGLSIVNTMTVSVNERMREMGIKRALGASGSRVALDVLIESAMFGVLGGLLGLLSGTIAARGLNVVVSAQAGLGLFEVTGRLLVGALAFAVGLGALSGAYPAWYAARVDPVDALAYE